MCCEMVTEREGEREGERETEREKILKTYQQKQE